MQNTNSYRGECALGRQYAARMLEDARATGDLPKLVQSIREMASAEGGVSIGYLFELGETAAYGLTDACKRNLLLPQQ